MCNSNSLHRLQVSRPIFKISTLTYLLRQKQIRNRLKSLFDFTNLPVVGIAYDGLYDLGEHICALPSLPTPMVSSGEFNTRHGFPVEDKLFDRS